MGRTERVAVGPLLRYLRRLRFRWLFLLTVALFAADLAVPDVIPFADEILLGLLATLLGVIRGRRRERGEPDGGSAESRARRDG